MKKIFVVGSINTDLVISTPKMPQIGETITGSNFFMAHGGKGANQAVAAARLGGKVIMCGCVGYDSFGKEAIDSFKKDGIDTSHVKTVKGVSSGTAIIIIEDGNNRIILDKGANGCLTEQDIDETLEQAEKGDIYLTQLENPIRIIGYGLKKAKEKGLFTILNPAPANKEIMPYLMYCDVITPNETETELLGGEKELRGKIGTLLITLGSKGFKIIDKDGERTYPCQKIKAVDTTAAGDTLCGGLVSRLSKGDNIDKAGQFGSKAATIACTRKGAQPSIPFESEVQ